jgi:putative membrane protein
MTRLLLAASAASLIGMAPAFAQTTRAANHLSSQDHTFVRMAAQSNMAEIQAGQLAETRAATPAVREYGRWMVTDHTMMNQMLQGIAHHEGLEVPTSPNAEQMRQAAELKNQQGTRFDTTYITAQVQDHESSVKAFQTEASAGQNMMLKRLAQSGLPVLQQHLTEARALLQSTGDRSVASAQTR